MKAKSKVIYSQLAEYCKNAQYGDDIKSDYLRVSVAEARVAIPNGAWCRDMMVFITNIECMVEGKNVKLPSMKKNLIIVQSKETEAHRNEILRSAIGLFDGLLKEWDSQYRAAPEKRDIQVY